MDTWKIVYGRWINQIDETNSINCINTVIINTKFGISYQ